MQLELPFCSGVVSAWAVKAGDHDSLRLAVTLTRSGAEASLTAARPFVPDDVGIEPHALVPHWRMRINLRPPVTATLELESEGDRTDEADIPVPGPSVVDSWDQQPLFAKPLAMAAMLLGKDDLLQGVLLTRKSLGLIARHLDSLWVKEALEAANPFPIQEGMRWYVYAAAANDETGRIAQMARNCPGVLILCKALANHGATDSAEQLLGEVIDGRRLGRVLDGAVAAWARAYKVRTCRSRFCMDVRLSPGIGNSQTQRLRIRRACKLVPPWVLWTGAPARLAAEDIPGHALDNLDWFAATSGRWMERAERRLSAAQLNGLLRFLACNWRWARGWRDELGRDWVPFMDHVVDYLANTGRVLRRKSSPRRLEDRLARWETDLTRNHTTYASDTPLKTFGLESWQMESGKFEVLKTVGHLVRESGRMGHCVSTYAEWAVEGAAVFFHGEVAQRPVTVELEPVQATGGFRLVEAVGLKNRRLEPEEVWVLRGWLAELNKSNIGCAYLK